MKKLLYLSYASLFGVGVFTLLSRIAGSDALIVLCDMSVLTCAGLSVIFALGAGILKGHGIND